MYNSVHTLKLRPWELSMLREEAVFGRTDVELLSTDTLLVWIRRPDRNHTNWWLCFFSTSVAETQAWNQAILRLTQELAMSPFHQGVWPSRRHGFGCHAVYHEGCAETTHAWELWMGCSDFALAFPDDPIADIRACGDEALERLYAAVPAITARASNLTQVFS
jgi:hypothetical protein